MSDWDDYLNKYIKQANKIVQRYTLGEAVQRERVYRAYGSKMACACSGPPCCIDFAKQGARLRYTAHLIVKQLDELRQRRETV